MDSRISRVVLRFLTLLALISFIALGIAAQDPDPNSPTPILLSESGSTRALAQSPRKIRGKSDLAKITPRAFSLDEKVELYVTNLRLMEGEGANAFRLYALDKAGHQFRFPVIAIEPIEAVNGVYRLTAALTDDIRYWEPPATDGDLLVYLGWRGLASNRVRLGIGRMGGDIKDDPGAKPTPLGTTPQDANRVESINAVGYRWSGDRFRFLEQATFGPNLTLDNRVRRIGLRTWINEQFETPYASTTNNCAAYPTITDPLAYPCEPLKPANQPTNCDGNQTTVPDVPVTCQRDTYSMYRPQTWFFKQAFYGDAQLRHRVSWALAQVWVTAFPEIQQGRHMVEYHKVLSKHAFGNYRNLMKEMTLNPTMGEYLNMRESTRTNPNENYAREIMQLFTIGLFMLNPDGTLQRDANNDPIPTYTQDGVNNLTKVFTGWGFCNTPALCPNLAAGTVNFIDPMILNVGVTTTNNNRHDLTAKTLLNYPGSNSTMNIPACTNCAVTPAATALANIQTYANNSLEQSLDNMFNHPNVGPFVGKILIQHMVTSDPTPAYVSRVAAKFNDNGFGVRGDMKAVIKAILLDPEARGDVKTDPNFGKLREPVLFFTNFARALGVRSANGAGQSDGNFTRGRTQFNNMAQVPFMSPTVFNFYPPDYGIPGTTLLGPEFAIMTTGTAVARATFVNFLTFVNTTAGNAPYPIPIPVSVPDSPDGTSFDFSDLVALSTADGTGSQLADELNRRMLHGTMSPDMKVAIQTAVTSYGATAHESRVRQAVYLVATSSQYQVQR